MEIYIPSGISEDKALETTHLAIAAHHDDIEIMAYDGILIALEKTISILQALLHQRCRKPKKRIYAHYTDEQCRLSERW